MRTLNSPRGAGGLEHGMMACFLKHEDLGSIQGFATCELSDPRQIPQSIQPHFGNM